jgi:1-acyl-sn-glycerol-3-phosphate acyltransferase
MARAMAARTGMKTVWRKLTAALDWLWRVLATGHCFSFLFVGGFILACTALPITRWFGRSEIEKQIRARRLLHRTFRFYLWQMQKLGLMTLTVRGREHLPHASGALVIANHPSLLDVVILISLLPDCDCVVKGSLRNSLVSGVIRAVGYTDNSEGEAMLRHCRDSMHNGFPLIVFPEGTRSTPNAPLHFQRGAANIAVRCAANILPALITCNPPTLLKNEPWYKIPAHRPAFVIEFFSPQSVAEIIDNNTPPSLATRQLNRQWLAFYQEKLFPH